MKVYKLKLSDSEVALKWGTWAMHRFCELNGNIPLSGLFTIYDQNTFSLKHVITMIQAAYESANEGETASDRVVGDWIDEGGGLTDSSSQILGFIRYTTGETVPDVTEKETEEKKSQ